MTISEAEAYRSGFLNRQVPILFERFCLFFEKEATCIEYFLCTQKRLRPVSRSLIVSHEVFSGSIYVSKFYPEIHRELNCKYLSAAFFYIMVHHAAGQFLLPDHCRVNLETDDEVFHRFYSRLNDFDFRICYDWPCEKVYLRGHYRQTRFPTDMILPAAGRVFD